MGRCDCDRWSRYSCFSISLYWLMKEYCETMQSAFGANTFACSR